MLHVTYFTCHMLHMLHVTNIKLKTILPKTQCVKYLERSCQIQFNGHDKNVEYHMLYVTCHTCYMSQISSYKLFYQRPSVSYIFGKLMQNTVD